MHSHFSRLQKHTIFILMYVTNRAALGNKGEEVEKGMIQKFSHKNARAKVIDVLANRANEVIKLNTEAYALQSMAFCSLPIFLSTWQKFKLEPKIINLSDTEQNRSPYFFVILSKVVISCDVCF